VEKKAFIVFCSAEKNDIFQHFWAKNGGKITKISPFNGNQ
jgi:hypothetical protein